MIIISPSELRKNQKKYFDLAESERVIVKRGKKVIELIVSDKISENPSPSDDSYFENPENLQMVAERIESYRKEKNAATLSSKNDIHHFLDKL